MYRYKALLVDDEPLILEGLESLIHWDQLGVEIVGKFLDGFEAIEFLAKPDPGVNHESCTGSNAVDIIITDIKMPDMDGLTMLRQLQTIKPGIKYIVLSGYDDFEYVKESIVLGIENYLLKPVNVNELVSTLKGAISKIEHERHKEIQYQQGMDTLKFSILNRWIAGNIEEEEFMDRSYILDINLHMPDIDIMAAVVRIPGDPQKITGRITPGKPQLQSAILRICKDRCGEVSAPVVKVLCFLNYEGDTVVLFLMKGIGPDMTPGSKKQVIAAAIGNTLECCISNILDGLKIDVLVTVGSLEKKYPGAHASYKNAIDIQEYHLILPTNRLIFYDDIKEFSGGPGGMISIDSGKLREIISSYDRNAVTAFIDNVYGNFSADGKPDSDLIHEVTLELLFSIKFFMKELSHNPDQFFFEFKDVFFNTFNFKSIDKLKEWIGSVLIAAIDFLDEKGRETGLIVKRAIDFIHRNYPSDINLKLIASDFNSNPVYLGYLFKKETGNTFTHYLNNIRLEAAKSLLANPKIKITDVAQKVGYYNTNYFHTIFKKTIGISPSEYQKKHKYH